MRNIKSLPKSEVKKNGKYSEAVYLTKKYAKCDAK